jgi:magnesium chelatase family protein
VYFSSSSENGNTASGELYYQTGTMVNSYLYTRQSFDIEIPRVDYEKLNSDRLGETSSSIQKRVQAARERQRVRFEGTDIVCPVRKPGLSQFRHACCGSASIL